jgi:hypothetical protein
MALKNDRYTYRVTWSEEDGEHGPVCRVSQLELAGIESRSRSQGHPQGRRRSRTGSRIQRRANPLATSREKLQREVHGAGTTNSASEPRR